MKISVIFTGGTIGSTMKVYAVVKNDRLIPMNQDFHELRILDTLQMACGHRIPKIAMLRLTVYDTNLKNCGPLTSQSPISALSIFSCTRFIQSRRLGK